MSKLHDVLPSIADVIAERKPDISEAEACARLKGHGGYIITKRLNSLYGGQPNVSYSVSIFGRTDHVIAGSRDRDSLEAAVSQALEKLGAPEVGGV